MDIDNTEGIDELPLFPLATVLFPGALMPLHIFEERYKEMMNFAIEHDGLFGLSYRNDADVGKETLPDIDSVGCVAKVSAVMPLEEGRMNIITSGVIRYRVKQLRQVVPFLIASVETFTDDIEPESDFDQLFSETRVMCKEFLKAAQALSESEASFDQELSEEPEAMSLLVSSMLPVDEDIKQALLEMTSTRLRLTRIRYYISTVMTEISRRLEIKERAKTNGHGKIK